MSSTLISAPSQHLRSGGLRVYAGFAIIGIGVAIASLLYHPTPTYDPWAWLVWGRELLHGHLALADGPSWKPMPVVFTTIFALFGSAAPNLWLIVARAGLVVTVLMLFKLAARLTSQAGGDAAGRRSVGAPAVLAGLIAAVGFLLGPGVTRNSALGNSEGVLIATTLIALELAFDGRGRMAFGFGMVAALDRPETWIVWVPYGVWLAWRDPGARILVVTLLVATALLWFVPQKLGGGSYTSAVAQAQLLHLGTVAGSSCPFCTDISKVAWPLVPWRIRAVALASIPIGLFVLMMVLRRRDRPGEDAAGQRAARWTRAARTAGGRDLALIIWGLCGAAGFGWLLAVAVESQGGFSGSARYMMLGMSLIYLAAGVGYGLAAVVVAVLIGRALRATRRHARTVAVVAATITAGVFMLVPAWAVGRVLNRPSSITQTLLEQGRLREQAEALIARAGGPRRLVHCGQIMSETLQTPMLSWLLQVPLSRITVDPHAARQTNRRIEVTPGSWPQTIFRDQPEKAALWRPGLNWIARWERAAGRPYRVFVLSEMRLYVNCHTRPR